MLYTKSDKIQQYTLGRKGGSNTGNLADNLMEELNCEKVFTLPVLGGINESVVVTWIIMAVLVIASIQANCRCHLRLAICKHSSQLHLLRRKQEKR